jgi:2-haloacid dehalogenase
LLAVVYKRLADEWGVPVPLNDCLAYGRSVEDWPAFEDSADALQYLKRHNKLVVLSNIDNASFVPSRLQHQLHIKSTLASSKVKIWLHCLESRGEYGAKHRCPF